MSEMISTAQSMAAVALLISTTTMREGCSNYDAAAPILNNNNNTMVPPVIWCCSLLLQRRRHVPEGWISHKLDVSRFADDPASVAEVFVPTSLLVDHAQRSGNAALAQWLSSSSIPKLFPCWP